MTEEELEIIEERHKRVNDERLANFDEWNTDAHADRRELIAEVRRLRRELGKD